MGTVKGLAGNDNECREINVLQVTSGQTCLGLTLPQLLALGNTERVGWAPDGPATKAD